MIINQKIVFLNSLIKTWYARLIICDPDAGFINQFRVNK